MDGLEGDAAAKERLRAILSTLSGELSVDEACRMLGIRQAYFWELRARALAGALTDLEPRTPGRRPNPPAATAEVVDELRSEVDAQHSDLDALQREVQILRAQLDVTTVLAKAAPAVPEEAQTPCSKSGSRPRRPVRRSRT